MRRRQVLDDHDGEVRVPREGAEEPLQRFEPARARAHRDHPRRLVRTHRGCAGRALLSPLAGANVFEVAQSSDSCRLSPAPMSFLPHLLFRGAPEEPSPNEIRPARVQPGRVRGSPGRGQSAPGARPGDPPRVRRRSPPRPRHAPPPRRASTRPDSEIRACCSASSAWRLRTEAPGPSFVSSASCRYAAAAARSALDRSRAASAWARAAAASPRSAFAVARAASCRSADRPRTNIGTLGARLASAGGLILRAPDEQLGEAIQGWRLREMRVEAGRHRALDVLRLRIARERDREHVAAGSDLAHRADDLVAAQVRQAHVAQDDVGRALGERRDARTSVERDARRGDLRAGGARRGSRRRRGCPRRAGWRGSGPAGPAAPGRRPPGRRRAAARRRTPPPVPVPSLTARTVPPCMATRLFTSARPMPSPAAVQPSRARRLRELLEDLPRGAAARSRRPCREPAARRRPPSLRATASTTPPGDVNLSAFPSRLPRICARRVSSPSTQSGSDVTSCLSATCFSSKAARTSSHARRTTSRASSRARSSAILPRLIRLMSSRSSTILVTCSI